jgi:hypothetical protein
LDVSWPEGAGDAVKMSNAGSLLQILTKTKRQHRNTAVDSQQLRVTGWGWGDDQAERKNAVPFGDGVLCFEIDKEEVFCPLQAWQRPTLPGLKP